MSRPKGKSGSRALWVVAGVAVVVTVTLISLGIMSSRKQSDTKAPIAAVKTDADLKANRNQMGKADAKVQIVEWGDYL